VPFLVVEFLLEYFITRHPTSHISILLLPIQPLPFAVIPAKNFPEQPQFATKCTAAKKPVPSGNTGDGSRKLHGSLITDFFIWS
jgi:hypothetical protein